MESSKSSGIVFNRLQSSDSPLSSEMKDRTWTGGLKENICAERDSEEMLASLAAHWGLTAAVWDATDRNTAREKRCGSERAWGFFSAISLSFHLTSHSLSHLLTSHSLSPTLPFTPHLCATIHKCRAGNYCTLTDRRYIFLYILYRDFGNVFRISEWPRSSVFLSFRLHRLYIHAHPAGQWIM